jgi:hypothetical protein
VFGYGAVDLPEIERGLAALQGVLARCCRGSRRQLLANPTVVIRAVVTASRPNNECAKQDRTGFCRHGIFRRYYLSLLRHALEADYQV